MLVYGYFMLNIGHVTLTHELVISVINDMNYFRQKHMQKHDLLNHHAATVVTISMCKYDIVRSVISHLNAKRVILRYKQA